MTLASAPVAGAALGPTGPHGRPESNLSAPSIISAMGDAALFGPFFAGESWSTWRGPKGGFCVADDR
jgi:hypothetical protein